MTNDVGANEQWTITQAADNEIFDNTLNLGRLLFYFLLAC